MNIGRLARRTVSDFLFFHPTLKNTWRAQVARIAIARIFYPAEPTQRPFVLERHFARSPRRVVSGGEFLRNFQPFYD